MTKVVQLRKDLETIRRAISATQNGEDPSKVIGEYMKALEKATMGMSKQQKVEYEHEIAKQTAKAYAEGKI